MCKNSGWCCQGPVYIVFCRSCSVDNTLHAEYDCSACWWPPPLVQVDNLAFGSLMSKLRLLLVQSCLTLLLVLSGPCSFPLMQIRLTWIHSCLALFLACQVAISDWWFCLIPAVITCKLLSFVILVALVTRKTLG